MFRFIAAMTLFTLAGIAHADSEAGSGGQTPAVVMAGDAQLADQSEVDSRCLKETGSLIQPQAGKCLMGPGKSYDSESMRRTGAISAADALGQMVPSLTIVR